MDTTDVKLLRDGMVKLMANADIWPDKRDKEKLRAFRALVSDKFTDEQIGHSYFKLPTGYGKTVMFARMARAYYNEIDATGAKRNKIIIIVPTLELIDQTQEKLTDFANIDATEYSGREKEINSDVIITTYYSLGKLFGVVDFNDVGLIFADEAHHMLGEKISERLTFYNKYVPIIGFTATPEYDTNRAVAKMLNTEIFALDIPEAVNRGVLSPVKNILYRSSIVCDLSSVPAKTNGDYDYQKITTQIDPEILATEIARIYAEGFDDETGIEFKTLKAIVNCPNSTIANLQAKKINEIMGRDVAVSLHKVGINDKKYDILKDEFKYGSQYKVACQVGTLTEGFDDKTVSLCINYPTRSRVKAEQTAGRAIRIDDNNSKKIAFVLDTIFRATANEPQEEILYTAANSHQVLFKDIAGGNMVLYPQDFQRQQTNAGERKTRNRDNAEFIDFELITDSATLLKLNRTAQERIADEHIPEKTDEWLSASDLVESSDISSRTWNNINNALKELEHDLEFEGYIKDMKTGYRVAKCLHVSKKQLFAERTGFKAYPVKTDEWLSANDLTKDPDFPSGKLVNINNALNDLEHDQEFEGFIQDIKTGSHVAKCLHVSKKQLFAERAGFKAYPIKTDEWLSASDLAKDPDFPSGKAANINNALKELEHDPEFEGYIKDMKIRGQVPKCLHVSKKQLFAERAGFKAYTKKTDEWLSANTLAKDPDFPSGKAANINNALKELEHDPEFEGYIKDMKTGAQVAKCLHVSKKQLFAERAGFKRQRYPVKTDEWLSANNLAKDPNFPSGSPANINNALKELEHDPEFEGFIQDMKIGIIQVAKCLHVSKKQLFAERAGFKAYTKKTDEWLSANTLAKDPDFPSGKSANINNVLKELEHDPEFEGYIKDMKTSGKVAKCIHRDKLELLKKYFQQKKIESLRTGTRKITTANATQDTKNDIVPDNQHQKYKNPENLY